MRITDVRVADAPIDSRIANAVIDFSRMTVSVVAVESDRVVDGERLVGYGFHSNGRYVQAGLLRRYVSRNVAANGHRSTAGPVRFPKRCGKRPHRPCRDGRSVATGTPR